MLSHVTKRLSLTQDEFLAAHPDLCPVTIPAEQFHQYAQESQVSRATFAISASDALESKEEEVTLIELNDGLRKRLGVDVEHVGGH